MQDGLVVRRFSRCLLAVVMLSFALVAGASAQTCAAWFVSDPGTSFAGPFGPFGSAGAACSALNGATSMSGSVTFTISGMAAVMSGSEAFCEGTNTRSDNGTTSSTNNTGGTGVATQSGTTSGPACSAGPSTPQNPSGQCSVGQSAMLTFASGTGTAPGGSACASNGCGYTANTTASEFTAIFGGCTVSGGCANTMQAHTSTGSVCSAGANAPTVGPPMTSGVQSSTCALEGGVVGCAITSATGVNGFSVAGDLVTPAQLPATGCVAYASGGVACVIPMGSTAPPTPPAPNNGTAGSVAAPAAVVTSAVAGSSTPVTGVYYNPAVVAGSTATVVANGTGVTSSPIGGVLGSGVSGSGTAASSAASSAADCDSANSSGEGGCADGTLPSLTRSDTPAGDAASMWAGIQSTPLFEAFGSISTALGSGGSCPTASVTFTTIKFTGDFMASFCSAFEGLLPTMIVISDAAWCVLGLLILLSA
jgi:collagen type VII alpha